MPRRADAHRGLAHLSRIRVLDEIHRESGLSLAELSRRTNLHENTLRDHVQVLVDEGFVVAEPEHRAKRGRPRTIYRAVTGADEVSSAAARSRILEAKEHGDLFRRVTGPTGFELDPDATHQIDALYEHLDRVGLDPEVDESTLTVRLTPCLFHGMIDSQPDVVCRVHGELIRSVLAQAGGPLELTRLLPFTQPHECRAHLARSSTSGDLSPAE